MAKSVIDITRFTRRISQQQIRSRMAQRLAMWLLRELYIVPHEIGLVCVLSSASRRDNKEALTDWIHRWLTESAPNYADTAPERCALRSALLSTLWRAGIEIDDSTSSAN